MTLQKITGELHALALAYPDSARVQATTHDTVGEVTGVSAISDESGITIRFEVAA